MATTEKHILYTELVFFSKKLIILVLVLFSHQYTISQEFNKNYFKVVNEYIDYVNFTVWGMSETTGYVSAASYIPEKYKDGKDRAFTKHLYFRSIKIDDRVEYYNLLQIRKYLNSTTYKVLNTITDSIHVVYNALLDKGKALRVIIYYKKYEEDEFKQFNKLYRELEYLYAKYDILLKLFRGEINKIVDKTLEADKDNPYRIYEKHMRNCLDYQLELFDNWYLYLYDEEFPCAKMKNHLSETESRFNDYVKNPKINSFVNYEYHRFYFFVLTESRIKKQKFIDRYEANDLMDLSNMAYGGSVGVCNIRCVYQHNSFVEKCKALNIYMLKYVKQAYIIKVDSSNNSGMYAEIENSMKDKTEEIELYESMDGYADNNLILLLDVSASMNSKEKLPLLKESFKRLLLILRETDILTIIIYSGEAQLVLKPTSCYEKEKIIKVLDELKSGGSTNLTDGLKLAYSTAESNFIANGNNRIILATDGRFHVDKKLSKLIKKKTKSNVSLSIFQFGELKVKNKILEELSSVSKGNYEFINSQNVALKLVKEVKAVKK